MSAFVRRLILVRLALHLALDSLDSDRAIQRFLLLPLYSLLPRSPVMWRECMNVRRLQPWPRDRCGSTATTICPHRQSGETCCKLTLLPCSVSIFPVVARSASEEVTGSDQQRKDADEYPSPKDKDKDEGSFAHTLTHCHTHIHVAASLKLRHATSKPRMQGQSLLCGVYVCRRKSKTGTMYFWVELSLSLASRSCLSHK